MKNNIKTLILSASVMLGISLIESSGIHFWIALAMVFVPFIILGIDKVNKRKEYEKALANSKNVDFLTDCVIFGEWEMN